MYPTKEIPLKGKAVENIVHGMIAAEPEWNHTVVHLTNELAEDLHGAEYEGIDYIRLNLPKYYKAWQFLPQKQISWMLEGYKFDVIHFHNLFPGCYLFNDLIKKQNIPYIITFRGSCALSLKRLYRNCVLKKFIENAKAYTFLSDYFYEMAMKALKKKNIHIKADKVHFIPNFKEDIWLDGAAKKEIGFPTKILCLANVEPRKNILKTIKAVELLQQKRKIELDIYGDVYDQKLFNEVSKRLTDTIRFHFVLKNEDIMKVIDESDMMFVCAHLETFGMAYIESILRQRPIIYPKEAGIEHFIKDNRYGVAVKNVLDSEEMAEAIDACIGNYLNYNFKGRERFTAHAVMPQWLKLYTQ